MHTTGADVGPPLGVLWGEIGWYEFGDNTRGIFTYAQERAPNGFRDFGELFPISTGQTLIMYLWANPQANNVYYAFYWYGNTWLVLDYYSIGQSWSDQTDQVIEVHTSDASHPGLPTTWIDNTLVNRCSPACGWVQWDTSIPQTISFPGLPYHAHFSNQYWKWYGHKH